MLTSLLSKIDFLFGRHLNLVST